MQSHGKRLRAGLAALVLAGAPAAAETCGPDASLAMRAVTRTIDAETLVLDNGAEVRLAGVLAPHAPASAEPSGWPLEEEARRTLEAAVRGHAIVAVPAPKAARDRYGRIVAQAYAVDGERRIWLQGVLLEAGLARATSTSGSAACDEEMRKVEAAARQAKRGLWADPAYRVFMAADTRELLAHAGEFVLVEGRVATVAAKSRRLYLDFGSDWRQDFTIAVPPAVMAREPEAAASLRAAAGKTVRVRGWIVRRNGPLIEVISTSAVEILADGNSKLPNEQRPAEPQPGAVETSDGGKQP